MNSDFMRRSPDVKPNDRIVDTGGGDAPDGNVAWLKRQKIQQGVLLLGGVTVDHFRVRVSQSRYRDDLAPSFWSMAGILLESGVVLTIPIDRLPSASTVPATNGVHRFNIRLFDRVAEFPNIAVLSFTDDLAPIEAAARRIEHSRAVLDLPSMMITWLSYVWATDAGSNPLRAGVGLPSAAFVETAFAACGVEISPGQRTASSSPEAIWQAARWWGGFYEVAAKNDQSVMQPKGVYRVTQWAAAAVGVRDDISGTVIRPAASKARGKQRTRGRRR
jgi:hypothetical protein